MKSTSKRLQIKCVTTRESGEVTFGGVKCGGGRQRAKDQNAHSNGDQF